MTRFILRYTGAGEKPPTDLRHIQGQPGVTVIDESSRMLLVEMPEEGASALKASLHSWSVSKDVIVPLPDSRERVN